MLLDSSDAEDQDRLANIEELITAARQFAAEDRSRTIGDFLENITLASDVDWWNEKQDCVSVMTMHSAKGLEFPVVYLTAVEQGLLPHERSLGREDEVEEERRLAFVGMTRAKEELYLCHARMREFRGQTLYAVPSMFLDELPREGVPTIDLSAGGGGRRRRWSTGAAAEARRRRRAGPTPACVRSRCRSRRACRRRRRRGRQIHRRHVGAPRHVWPGTHHRGERPGGAAQGQDSLRTAGERTFIADKVTLEILRKG